MILRHYSSEPLRQADLRSVPLKNSERLVGKPTGLWLSDESGDPSWSQWCEDNDFEFGQFWTDFEVDLTDVKHLETPFDILSVPTKPKTMFVEWEPLLKGYKGLLITPYQWSVRLDVLWYYGWDCASGVFWDVSCLKEVDHGKRKNKTMVRSSTIP